VCEATQHAAFSVESNWRKRLLQELELAEIEKSRAALLSLDDAEEDDDAVDAGDARPTGAGGRRGEQQQRHWVQHYAPRSYMQLLSAESVNVQVWCLRWRWPIAAAACGRHCLGKCTDVVMGTATCESSSPCKQSQRHDCRAASCCGLQ
jgi:hypothetical protein